MARPIIPALARSIRTAKNNQTSNMGVGAQSGAGALNAFFINQSAYLRMRQAGLGPVQSIMGALGWGPYFSAAAVALWVTALKILQASHGDDAQLVTNRAKALDRWLAGWHVPAAIVAIVVPHLTAFFNAIMDEAIPEANSVLSSQATDVANVAAAQLIVDQGNT